MEDLNKTQTILLALLVSFVSSVAVSIMTYSILSEDPLTVTQTINRVVEKTIETVVPTQVDNVITKEVTVIVKEEDLIIDSIIKNKENLVRIFDKAGEGKTFLNIGFILNNEGLIVTPKVDFLVESSFIGILNDDTEVPIKLSTSGVFFSFFNILDLGDRKLSGVLFGDSDSLQLGQTITSIRGEEEDVVAVGRITSFSAVPENETGEENKVPSKYSLIETDIVDGNTGSPAINLKGEMVGIKIPAETGFLPINILKQEMANLSL